MSRVDKAQNFPAQRERASLYQGLLALAEQTVDGMRSTPGVEPW